MGKRSRKERPKSDSKIKIAIAGAVVAVIIGAVAFMSMDPESIKADTIKPTKLSLDTTNGSPILGDPEAPITIVEFGDYQCPFCKRWHDNTLPLIEERLIKPGVASLIYVDFPIIGPDSVKVHAGSYCAEDQGLYWQYHNHAYASQGHENDGWANAENVKILASEISGLDSDAFNECMDSKKYEQRVNDNRKVASDSGSRSTPSFIIISPDGSGETIIGAQPSEAFESVVYEMLNQ